MLDHIICMSVAAKRKNNDKCFFLMKPFFLPKLEGWSKLWSIKTPFLSRGVMRLQSFPYLVLRRSVNSAPPANTAQNIMSDVDTEKQDSTVSRLLYKIHKGIFHWLPACGAQTVR